MKIKRKHVALTFMLIGAGLALSFYLSTTFPGDLPGYFNSEYYLQYGPLAISVELLISGIYLFTNERKANFSLALFGFTALLDPIFNLTGLFTSMVPIFATVIFILCGIVALWIAFTDSFNTGKISLAAAFGSFILGTALELFFNYLLVG